jgi:hypothetical protein
MMRRSLLASVMLAALTAVLAVHAGEPTKNKDIPPIGIDKKDGRPTLSAKQLEELQKQVREKYGKFYRALSDLAESYSKSSDPALQAKGANLRKILTESDNLEITARLAKYIKFLSEQKGNLDGTDKIEAAVTDAKQLARDLGIILKMLKDDNGASSKKDERLALEKMLKELDKVIRDEKIVRNSIDSNPDRKSVADDQNQVATDTQKLVPKDGTGSEDKGPGKAKEQGSGENSKNKPNDKADPGKANSKESGQGDKGQAKEAKNGEGDKNPAKSGAKEGKGSEKGAQTKDPKGAKEGADPAKSKDGKGNEAAPAGKGKDDGKQGGDKPGQSKAGDDKQGGKQGGAKDAKGSEGAKSGQAKDAKGGEAGEASKSKDGQAGEAGKGKDGGKKDDQASADKPGQTKPGGEKATGDKKDDKQGNSKAGQGSEASKAGASKKSDSPKADASASKSGGEAPKSDGQGQAKSGSPSQGQPKSGQPDDAAASKSDNKPPPANNQPKDDLQTTKQKIQDAIENMKKAQENVEASKIPEAGKNADDAIKDLETAKKKLEDLIRQLREEELERILANLIDRCQKMLAMQQAVLDGTIKTRNQIDNSPGKKGDRDTSLASLGLSDDELKIVEEATKAIEILEGEGSAVAFPEVFRQLREDMKHVQRRLKVINCDDFTIGLEEDIIETLKDMIAALKKAEKDLKDKKNPPPKDKDGPPPPPQDQKLLEKIQELKMIRAMQLRVNSRTEKYATAYPIGTPTSEQVQAELRELIQRQEQIIDVTNKISKGDNQ